MVNMVHDAKYRDVSIAIVNATMVAFSSKHQCAYRIKELFCDCRLFVLDLLVI